MPVLRNVWGSAQAAMGGSEYRYAGALPGIARASRRYGQARKHGMGRFASARIGGRTLGRSVGRAIVGGTKDAMFGYLPLAVPLAGFAASQAPQGQKLSTFAGGAFPMVGTMAGFALAGAPGALVGGLVFDTMIGDYVRRGVQAFSELNGKMSRLEMGGRYQDTEQAWTMRQAAIKEMGSARSRLLNARSYLGQESVLLHQ